MKCEFCGSEDLLNPQAKRAAKPLYVYDTKELAYFEVKPSQYLICRNCGRTDTYSILRKLSPTEAEGLRYCNNL